MSTVLKDLGRFKVGDWVSFRFGISRRIAQVVEERGPLGVNRRYLYRVSVPREGLEPDSFEIAEDSLEPASPPDKPGIMSYLKQDGLVQILQANSGGRSQPRVWLTYSPQGRLTHSFLVDRNERGGVPVPFSALRDGKIFKPMIGKVMELLEKFGLNHREAEEVIAAIGTAP